MDRIDRDLLNMVQHEFPLNRRPYAIMAGKLGISEVECIDRLAALKREGILREIRPVINWKKVGFTGILIGMKVDPDRIDAVAEKINELNGVTHNYKREGELNLWCTLTFDGVEEKNRHIAFMRSLPGVRDLREFASEKTYKIGLLLNV
jgi:DNA-binding Lrp family transcriptional regulator